MAEPKSKPDGGSRDQLARLLNPLDLVVLTRDRLQDAFDDAVARGRMTRDDATELLDGILSFGRRSTEEFFEQLEGATQDIGRRVDRARRAAGIGSAFPIAGYDDLTAANVAGRLEGLTPAELRKVRDYERRNANRKTVLAAIESKL